METMKGEINLSYEWPLGAADRVFFSALRDDAVLTGARCNACDRVMVPPRPFCEECFGRDVTYEAVAATGEVTTFAESYFSLDGKQLDEPFFVGIVKLDGTDGGLLHHIEPNGAEVKMGARVAAVFEEDRSGSILDIRHFAITSGEAAGE